MRLQVAALISGLVATSVTTVGTVGSLSGLGVSSNRDGFITLDSGKFEAALAKDPAGVAAVFGAGGQEGSGGISAFLEALRTRLNNPGGAIAAMTKRLEGEAARLLRERDAMEASASRFADQLNRRFAGLDARVGALKSIQSYLDQQVKLWTRSG